MKDLIVCGTGHRPNKLGGYTHEAEAMLHTLANWWLSANRPKEVITGMALGWDTALAISSYNLGIPYTAAIPFRGQEEMWPQKSQDKYNLLLSKAKDIVIVCEGGYSSQKMQLRNIWMVDNSQGILALWDGTSGGTHNCVKYAKTTKKPIYNIWEHYLSLLQDNRK